MTKDIMMWGLRLRRACGIFEANRCQSYREHHTTILPYNMTGEKYSVTVVRQTSFGIIAIGTGTTTNGLLQSGRESGLKSTYSVGRQSL